MRYRKQMVIMILIMIAVFALPGTGTRTLAVSREVFAFNLVNKSPHYRNQWIKCGKKTYYVNKAGKMIMGWKKIRGKRYYFSRMGELVRSSWVGNRYVDKNGCMVKNRTVNNRRIGKDGSIKQIAKTDQLLIIGASKSVDMSFVAKSKDTVFIAKEGQGYEWLVHTAAKQMDRYLKQNPTCTVVFDIGGNDVYNVEEYIRYYSKLLMKYPEADFRFLDLTPGESEYKNLQHRQFNARLKEAFGGRCLGGYDYLVSTGYKTVDIRHYTRETTEKVYRFIRRKVSEGLPFL